MFTEKSRQQSVWTGISDLFITKAVRKKGIPQ
jgi:hypothetical protein